MSKLEKCISGNIFNCAAHELLDRMHKARTFTCQYNSSSNTEEKEDILNELLGKMGSIRNCAAFGNLGIIIKRLSIEVE